MFKIFTIPVQSLQISEVLSFKCLIYTISKFKIVQGLNT